jgi:23S rRNA pseudouridine2605 synthase
MERLQKFLAHSGVASRRKSEEFITAGLVTVNGKVITRLGTSIDPATDKIIVNGALVKPEKPIYIAINKPRDYVCSSSDPERRPLVLDLVRHVSQRIYTVGRLDCDTEGLLLITNDGDFANRITHPKQKIPKVYYVRVKGDIDKEKMKILQSPMMIDGKRTRSAQVELLSSRGNKHELSITIYEGRNRQIKQMFEQIRCWVLRLRRVSIGNLELGDLRPGQYRVLTEQEMVLLK